MSLTAAAIRLLADHGLNGHQIAEVAEANYVAGQHPVIDAVAEKRRAYDRERKRAKSTGNSTGIPPDTLPETKVSPTPPSKTQTIPTPSPPKGGSVPTSRAFDQFWLAYPRKVGKDAARRKFVLAWKRIVAAEPEADPLATMLAALDRAKAEWTEVEAQFIPHPATWLHQGRWQDEAMVRSGQPPPIRINEAALAEHRAKQLAYLQSLDQAADA